MWRRVVWQVAMLLLVSGSSDVRYYAQKRPYTSTPQVECFDYMEWGPGRYNRGVPGGAVQHSRSPGTLLDGTTYSSPSFVRHHLFSRRVDLLPSGVEDVVKEHAKLVQDINSMKQPLYVAPMVDRSKDYDESIYLEAIETTTTPRPTTTSKIFPTRSKKPGSSIPVILVGGASQRTVLKSPPFKYNKTLAKKSLKYFTSFVSDVAPR
ncbi:unnamed protein product [Parnassius apollo]|uniref:(apollo) hypothetical protein n=1 Tax=Parnassius apollo TaxID=110799 RepID=A0A8S3X7V5_PARAO|nr:unnamed protein product [Parnassius apollo]